MTYTRRTCYWSIGHTMAILSVVVCLLLPAHGLADGYRNPTEGAAAQGRAGARLTKALDPSTTAANPANLMDLDRAAVMPTVTFGYLSTDYTAPWGQREESDNPWKILPGVFGVWPLADGKYAAGMGVHIPYGQSSEWDKQGVFAERAPYFAEMSTVNVNPSIATRLSDNVSVGAGIDIMRSDLKFRQIFQSTRLAFEGDGVGVGGNVGVTWQVGDAHRLAAIYRSPVDIEYDGDFEMDGPMAATLPPTASASSDFETELKFPTVIGVGYGWQVNDTLHVEADVEWVEHSRNEAIELDVDNNNMLLASALGSNELTQDWDDTWTFAIGADWRFAQEWTLRGGYTYLPSPIPDETFMPYLPQGDKNLFALGLGFHRGRQKVDVAYTISLEDERDINNGPNPVTGQPYPANGEYEFDVQLVCVSYNLAF